MTSNDPDIQPANDQPAECRWVRSNLPAYALNTIAEEDAIRVDEHLLVCALCNAERRVWDATVPMLALSAPGTTPAPALKDRIMAATRTVETRSPEAPVLLSLPAFGTPSIPPRPIQPTRSWGRFGSRFAAIPVLALIMILTIVTVTTQQHLAREQDRADRLERENAAITANFLVLQAGAGEQGVNARWYPLLSVDESFAEAGGVVLGDPSQSTALLSVWNMPETIGPFHVICESELGELLAAGELQVNDLGIGSITLNLPGPMTEYRVVHIVHADDLADGGDPRTRDVLLVRLEDPTVTPRID